MTNRSRPPNRARPCRKGLHVIPAGVMGCQPCNTATKEAREAEYKRTRREAAKKPMRGTPRKGISQPPRLPIGSIPPDEVLNGALCGPATAALFDPMERGDELRGPASERQRIAKAQAICATCPVWDLCRADAVANKRLGVYGGTYLSPKYYEKRRSQAVVQSVKSAVEYPA